MAVGRLSLIAALCAASVFSQAKENALAVTNAGVQRSEDGANVAASFKFLPGEFVHFTFQIAGFKSTTATNTQPSKFSLEYTVSILDGAGVLLAEPVSDKITGELNAEDKDWTPKRRVAFQLPSFVAAGNCRLRVAAKDQIGQTETASDFSFQIGGPAILASERVGVQAFQFFRSESDREALDIAAYQPGDTVFARFRIAGFKKAEENRYRVSYRVMVLRPDGKPFLRETPDTALENKSFYPAPYAPAEIDVTVPKTAAKGRYRLLVAVRDLLANADSSYETSFTVE